ncbi:HesB-like domain containing protein [Trichomonas vaginalis G3]|uniref:HesB-like domain containing protein n=1 Tax=Trichomonas vaginalis (strain ATCC PRA-98 / G3) TaxID=412133 RepID=A2DC01_TRIV3|nr:protein maturation by iron-sulfur cluster transfer [Trichomonas vaginalis G3]EAY22042.1 HesB-like domain containing protein [Trichomonas vaginalis G3]KAI5525333.1 protein maturation by iron-sulfur cluster transfer [Trichomonas vaginalis G3]|eukprot:XP_001583028.1 HesB-like domain containing protein [Trichomonas vaginalis G3]
MLSSIIRSFAKARPAFDITPAAAKQIKKLLIGDCENRMMRIGLKAGGCSGFQYDFSFDSHARKGDSLFKKDGAQVVLDEKSLFYLRHSTLDFVDDKFSSAFKVVLPQDTTMHSCSCGRSVGTDNNPGACLH